MNHRYMPFGYYVKEGAVTVKTEEADVIKLIFTQYVSGMSLKKIAEMLTFEKVEFLPQQYLWNKNRVARIIEDSRYTGTDVYEAIIDTETFETAQEMKLSRNTQADHDRSRVISSSVVPIICGRCGCITHRTLDKRRREPQRFICRNPDCRAEYIITDEQMLNMLRKVLENRSPVSKRETLSDTLSEINRLEREIDAGIEYLDTDAEIIRAKIFECANAKYQAISQDRANADKLEQDLSKTDFRLDRRTVMELVRQIKLLTDEQIEVTLISGEIMRKEPYNGTDSTGRENRQGDCSDNHNHNG